MIRAWLALVSLWLEPEERERWREEWAADLEAHERRGDPWTGRALWAAGVGLAVARIRFEGASMDGWGRELKNAIRGLLRRPAFTVVAVLTLGLGIGANTAIFSVVNGVILEPLRYPESEELVKITTAFPTMDFYEFWVSPPEYMELAERARSFEVIGGYRGFQASVGGGEQPERVPAVVATASMFEVLGVDPMIGRAFTAEEDLPNGPAVAVMSWELWTRSYGGDRSILGRSIPVNGTPTTIIGVMPREFDLEDNAFGLWLPVRIDPTNFQNRGSHFLEVLGRLRDGTTTEAASRELATLVERWEEDSGGAGHVPNPEGHPMAIEGLQEDVVGDVRPALFVLLGSVGFVLLIACANVGNLLLARAEDRQKEVSVRVALGAGRGRLLRQFLTEGVVLSILGAAVGLGVAWASLEVLQAASPGDVPRLAEIALDGRVLGVTSAIAVAVGIFFGLAPARHVVFGSLAASLRDGGTRTTDTGRRRGLRSLLVISEMALALMLAVGAGLMLRSFESLTSVEPGFEPEGILSFELFLPASGYPDGESLAAFWAQIETELEARPEFEAVAITGELPPNQTLSANDTEFESVERTPDGPPHNVDYYTDISSDYVETMGLTLVEGRDFGPQDARGSTPVVLVNRALAERFYPDRSPVGERLAPCCGGDMYEIVGVVENVKQNGLDQPSGTEIYLHVEQQAPRSNFVVGKVRGDMAGAMAAAREVVWGFDGTLPLARMRTMDSVVGEALARSRFLTGLMAAFAGLALLLAAVGTYGVMSYSVAQRGRELGIRMAMGAEAGVVQRLVLGQGLFVAAIGLVLGVGGAWALTGVLESMLFDVDARDPFAFIGGPILLSLVAVAACWLPARRATRVDPVTVLREE